MYTDTDLSSSNVGTNINLNIKDFNAIKTFVLENQVDMVVVGPEDPLVKGVYDFFKTVGAPA